MGKHGLIMIGFAVMLQMQLADAEMNPLPEPNILQVNYDSPITIDEWAKIYVRVRNDGGDSDEGGISISFPSFTSASDDRYVDKTSCSGDIGYSEYPKGNIIWHKNGYQFSGNYLLVEGVDLNWIGNGNEENYLEVKVQPQETGSFVFYVRSAMGQSGTYVNDPSTGTQDQQGWPVLKRTIQVKPEEQGSITVTSPNGGEEWCMGTREYICGQAENVPASCQIDIYLDWATDNRQIGAYYLNTPNAGFGVWREVPTDISPRTDYRIYMITQSSPSYSDYSNYFTIVASPKPNIRKVTLESNEIALGDWNTVSVDVRNDGGGSDEGAISISFPAFTSSGDNQYVQKISTSSDVQYTEYPKGSSIWHRNGYQFSANYLLVEGVDLNWISGEENNMKIRFKPQNTGSFVFYVRSAMGHDGNYFNEPSTGPVDQQDWNVKEYRVTVNEAESITVTRPQSGDNWEMGKTYGVKWNWTGSIDDVSIVLCKGGRTVTGIVSSTPCNGNHFWSIPTTLVSGNDYQVRIDGTSCDDFSDYFTIYETGIEETSSTIPKSFCLYQNHPNPATLRTSIAYGVPLQSSAAIKIYNCMGKEIRTLVNTKVKAGYHMISWDCTDNGNKRVASGIYFYRMEAGDFKATRKLTMLR